VASYEVSGVVAQLGARRYKYLHGRHDDHEELYDLSQAESESRNLAGNQAAHTIMETMRRLHQQLLLQNGTDSSLNRTVDKRK
jgi:hypothetical protein